MRRESHVRACEGGGVRFPSATRRLVHCRNEQEAQALKAELQARLAECRLECIRRKPRSSTAKTGNARASIRTPSLTSSGIAFGPVWFDAPKTTHCFGGFNPAVSASALKSMRATIRDLDLRHRTQLSVGEIARQINPLLRGWIEYYGRYAPSALEPLLRYVNQTLVAEVQALQGSQGSCESLSSKAGSGKRETFRALAARYDRYVRLMGAVLRIPI
jgi:Group II intron, maturase-specific domain